MSKKSSSFRRISKESHKERFLTTSNLLILEKALEQSGQEWIENVNIIEQLLVRLVDRLGQDNPNLKSKFITRRLQTYQVRFFIIILIFLEALYFISLRIYRPRFLIKTSME
jgi:hypothetical protein